MMRKKILVATAALCLSTSSFNAVAADGLDWLRCIFSFGLVCINGSGPGFNLDWKENR